jgi:hypothetical protein
MPTNTSTLIQLAGNNLPALQKHLSNYIGNGADDLLRGDFTLTNGYYTHQTGAAYFLNTEPDSVNRLFFKNDTNDFLLIIQASTKDTDPLLTSFPILNDPTKDQPQNDAISYLPIVPPLDLGVVKWQYLYFSTDDETKQKTLWETFQAAFPDSIDFETFASLTESETQYQIDREDPSKSSVEQKWQGGLYFRNTVTRFPFDFIEDNGNLLGLLTSATGFEFKTIGSVFHPRYNGYQVHRPVFHVRVPLEAQDYTDSIISRTELYLEFFSKSEYSSEPIEISLTGKIFLDNNKYELDIVASWPVANNLFEFICKCKINEIPFFDSTMVPGLEGSAEADIEVLVRISLDDKSFHSAAFIATLENWPIITDILALKELKLTTRLFNLGGSKSVFVGVDAKAIVGKNGIELDCGGSYPEGQFYFGLNPNTPIQLHDIVEAFLGNHGGIPEGLAIIELSGQFNYTSKDVFFSMAIGETVPWIIANEFELKKIRLAVSGQGSLSAQVYANFEINGLGFTVSAEFGDGWSFEATYDKGKTSGINIPMLADAFGFRNPSLPDFIANFTIEDIALSFKTGPSAQEGDKNAPKPKTEKHFKISGSDILNEDTADPVTIKFELKLDVTYPDGTTPSTAFSGHMIINDTYDFDIVQQKDGEGKLLLASYHQEGNSGETVDIISLLLNGLGVPDAPAMDLSLQDAFFVNGNKTNGGSLNLLVADIAAGMNISNLPLVGKILPKDATVSLALRVLYASASYTDYVDKVNGVLPQGISPIAPPESENNNNGSEPPTSPPSQKPANAGKELELIAQIDIGEQTFNLDLPIKIKPKKGEPPTDKTPKQEITEEDTTADATGTTDTTTSPPNAAPSSPSNSRVPVNDGITWFKIGKTFGPVVFNRLGLTYKNKALTVYPDAALSMGGLTFTLNGLSVSSPIKEFKPTFDLKGLGLDFAKGPIEIGASFLRRPLMIDNVQVLDKLGNPVYEYDGMATIKTDPFSISALGSYAYVDDHASLFIYAYLDQALGGPAFFYVEGLAAAFGYNRSLLMPTIDQVSMFPLVRQVMADQAPDETDKAALLTQQLDALSKYIPPDIGQMFIAIGVKFNSFKLLDSFALLAVSFGNRVEIDLLGQTNIIVPSEVPPDVPPLAEIKIQLLAKIIPEEGFLGVQAQLTKDSYVLSKDCHLTGGAAFYSWFSGDHEGDFVVTLGGYHPAFNVPSHYPQVPRLGVNWQVVPELSIKGDMYFALCAHAFMAGGHLEALYESGPLKAWFKAGADFLISWQPYHYDARIYIDLGASYTYELFGTHTITLDLGADVHIWGPEFAGTASIRILIFDISVAFGPEGSATPDPISWDDFKKKCLPDKKEISGAITHGQHGEDADNVPIVNPKELTISLSSPVPVSNFDIPRGSILFLKNDDGKKIDVPIVEQEGHIPTFDIAPMELTSGISSAQRITITIDNEPLPDDEGPNFQFELIKKKLPAALWGDSFTPDLNTKKKNIELVTGVTIKTVNALADKEGFEKPPGKEPTILDCASTDLEEIIYEPLSPSVPVELLEDLGIELDTLTQT